jgi:peptidoglycan/xylan/chitin deacetylase (PgdA/CDA1 family)
MFKVFLLRRVFIILLLVAGHALAAPAPIRFLLTFDDGPSGRGGDNPTAKILDALDDNPVQPGIKALFFIQTRAVNGGATEVGQALLRREYQAGHLLGLHTATPRHASHRGLEPAALDASLALGVADLRALTGAAPRLLRPPFWNYDARTLAAYHRAGLQMLLTDLSAKDGKIYGINFSLHKRSNLRAMLLAQRESWRAGALPQVDGSTPIVVTFHDLNGYTASVIKDYLAILVDVARELDMATAARPFYDTRDDIERAALTRTVSNAAQRPALPGLWDWLWQ